MERTEKTNDELIDIVNETDEVIGRQLRSQLSKDFKNYRMVGALLIYNESICVPKRSLSKRSYPGYWGMVGGFVKAGESYDQALKRELLEETNLEIENLSYQLLGRFNPYKEMSIAFTSIYEIKLIEIPKFNKDDFSSFALMNPSEILDRFNHAEKVMPYFAQLVKKFYLN